MTNILLIQGKTCQVCEWSFESARSYSEPFNEVELDVLISNEAGQSWRVPAFWAGGGRWKVRFAPPTAGVYNFITFCTQADDSSLHNVCGTLDIASYEDGNPLLAHGPLGISPDQRHFVFEDGRPFFWLGDTWWMAITGRMKPEMVRSLAADRLSKGFSVIQLVAGLYPDMDWGDPRGANAAGLPYNTDFSEINPAYFDEADAKIKYLVEQRLMPCIVGCWGYFLNWMGVEKIERHWRYLIARWSAYPVIWCLAGEATYAYHMSETSEQDSQDQKLGWARVGHYVRQTDPMHHLITIHPIDCGRDNVADDSFMDFEMLQTFHLDHESIPVTAREIKKQRQLAPPMPVLDAEVCYEGIMGGCYDNVQRAAFWVSILSGAAGHTYGANGIWQVNESERPYGPSSHGTNWGNRPWDEAMNLPGSAHLGVGKSVLERYRWWEFEPRQDWAEPAADDENAWRNYAAGIPGRIRVIYIPRPVFWGQYVYVCGLEAGVNYEATLINPATGEEFGLGPITVDAENKWTVPVLPEMRDWLLILESGNACQYRSG